MAKPSSAFVFDTRHDPLHLQVIPRSFTWPALDAHFGEIEAFYSAYVAARPRAHIALLADARDTLYVDARSRKRIAETFERLSPLLDAEHSVAHAVVTNSALTRGALTAILWLYSPPWQIRVFTSMHEGDAWLREVLTTRGLAHALPPPGWWEDRRRAIV